jgi:hypothetical protein
MEKQRGFLSTHVLFPAKDPTKYEIVEPPARK